MRFYALARKDGGVTILQTLIPVAEVLVKWHPDVLAQHTGEYKEISQEGIPERSGRTRAWFNAL
jgi:hypothetical protein